MMKVNLAYIVPESFDYQIENFNNFVNIELIKFTDELADLIDKNLLDVLVIDDNVSDRFDILKNICSGNLNFKTYYLFDESEPKNIVWAINQPWIDKIIPSNGENDFAITQDVLAVATEDSKLMMDNKQLVQDNRELEFVISQMLLVE